MAGSWWADRRAYSIYLSSSSFYRGVSSIYSSYSIYLFVTAEHLLFIHIISILSIHLLQAGIFYVTLLLVIGTSGLFFAFDCPFLTERISPVIPVVGAVLFIFVLSNLLKTSFSDPGIIPRATNAEAENIEREIEQPNGAGQAYRPPPRTKEIQVRDEKNEKEKFWSFVENFAKRQKLLNLLPGIG